MDLKISAAVIGCGRMGAFTSDSVKQFSPPYWLPLSHADAMQAHPAVSLDGFCDNDAAAVDRACAAYGVSYGTTDFAALFETVRPQMLGVATRTVGRADILLAAKAAGVRAMHVEKPLCNSVTELETLESAMADGGLFMTLGTVRRFIDVFTVAKSIACSGRFGAMCEIRASYGIAALYWSHPHTVDMILHIAEGRRVAAVSARLAGVDYGQTPLTIQSDPLVDYATILFDDGVVGHIGRAPGYAIEIACESGTVTVHADGPEIELLLFEDGNPYPLRKLYDGPVDVTAPQGSYGPIDQLVRCLGGEADAMTANQIVRSDIFTGQRVLFAMVQSHIEGSRPVALADIDPAMVILAQTDGRYA